MIEKLRPHLEPWRFAAALDIGCGTGASARPLTSVARRVVGLDPSLAMLAHAGRSRAVDYVAGRAEALPFETGSFDLLTVSSAFHWLDRDRFLAEALRVVSPAGRLVVYDNFFANETEDGGAEGIGSWLREIHWKRYPYPPRASVEFAPGENVDPGFRCETRDEYQNLVEFTRDGLVDYLVTQTNVIAAVEEGDESMDEVRGWLLRDLAPFFEGHESRRLMFECPIWILRPR
ncbi:MAG TPA: class I SAM-dependent methyltransferase [Gemmatimonadota bacterium]|nr:class I SAM-dependent methyltransferase [Gemmatimonadota bacterium]